MATKVSMVNKKMQSQRVVKESTNGYTVKPQPKLAKKKRVEIGEYLVIDPEICHGKMTFKGTRVPVETILTFLSMGYSMDVLQHSYPEVAREGIAEAVRMAREALLWQHKRTLAQAQP